MRPRLAILLLPALLLTACAPTDDTSSLVVALELTLDRAALEIPADTPLRDALGLFDLPLFTVYVALEVTADDMEPVTGEWPADPQDLADFDGTAVVELDVSPGNARSLDGVVLSWDGGRARVYAPGLPLVVNLAAGAFEDVELVLVEAEYGNLSGTAPEGAHGVEIVDLVTDVILARASPGVDGMFVVEGLPIQRPLYPVWSLGAGVRTPAPELATHIPGAGGGATFPAPR
ncbi:MAG: hypothetical protein ABIK09_09495 [Pseudomonadota bacterium]